MITISRHRRTNTDRGAVIAMVAGVLLAATISAYLLGTRQHADEREQLVSRVVAACAEDRIQTYLLHEACREANEQAVDIGLKRVPLPALEPAPIAPR